MRVHLDKIASVTRGLRLQRTVTTTDAIRATAGTVVVGRVRGEKSTYNHLEDVHGRMTVLHDGDVVAGALGHRNALHGYEGVVPETAAAGDVLNILNLGGVIGRCVSRNPEVGPPFEIELLGQVLAYPDFQSRQAQPASIALGALGGRDVASVPPVVYVMGTCMNAGKTAAASAIVRAFTRAGFKVGGAKLTGVSLMRDILAMSDYGAEVSLDFTDAGIVSTGPETAPAVGHILFSELAARGMDVIVAETGDGIMGEYGVQALLADAVLRARGRAFVLCANDPVGVAGGVGYLRDRFGVAVDVVAGPATDNQVGVRFVERELGLPAINARTNPGALGGAILGRVGLAAAGAGL
ncbi:MAG TPA: hypothetical protein VK911_04670 [Vicinamibacterales bacterium]|nr:hypothetical protein [Vicinamibacterales bacterium]